ncbi:ferredoxin--NADP reductase [Nocardia pseudobrasiliensis]|uniref:3-ketosteroid 9alpha-monooxygenase subunit B n=1 Tax=Nocardia pseudobrasiliensis TaxID=45979 RepID=A0A370HQ39_9NOCA|nr:ferredoxin--NADP reductase [Nocardia pseudobrasiliensis]RDI60607.1 3-ketosteroid 9alpha-monooxygenase subunit B [Nocardia pseudobrasiliensis]
MNPRAHRIKVLDVIVETADAVSLVFDTPGDLAARFAYAPGQFLTVEVPSERTGSVARCYSLSSSPHCEDRLTITVKRTRGGYASNWLCDNITAGSILTVLEPSGTFTPRSLHRDVVLFAGGSGITPIMSIIKSVLIGGIGAVVVLYANRDAESIIFAAGLRELAQRFPQRLSVTHWLESECGLPTVDRLAAWARPHRGHDVYLCGPEEFMRAVHAALDRLGVPESVVRQEDYRSLTDNPFESPTRRAAAAQANGDHPALTVEIDGQIHRLRWPRQQKLLDLLLDHGIDAPYVCRESACGTCVCSVKRGRTRMLVREALIDDELAQGLTLACQTLPESDELHIVFDQ